MVNHFPYPVHYIKAEIELYDDVHYVIKKMKWYLCSREFLRLEKRENLLILPMKYLVFMIITYGSSAINGNDVICKLCAFWPLWSIIADEEVVI